MYMQLLAKKYATTCRMHQAQLKFHTQITINWKSIKIFNDNQHVHLDFRRWHEITVERYHDSKVHGTNIGYTWVLSSPGGPHVGPMNLAIWDIAINRRTRVMWCWRFIAHAARGSVAVLRNGCVTHTSWYNRPYVLNGIDIRTLCWPQKVINCRTGKTLPGLSLFYDVNPA